jgi:hypothetical protein
MLTQEQKKLILQKILNEPKVPSYLKRGLGHVMFPLLVNEVNTLLSGALPPQIQTLINSASDGLTPEEISHLSQALIGYATEKIKSPILQTVMPIVLPLIVNVIIDALEHGKTITA